MLASLHANETLLSEINAKIDELTRAIASLTKKSTLFNGLKVFLFEARRFVSCHHSSSPSSHLCCLFVDPLCAEYTLTS
jgi:hypothetical protein